MKYLPLKGRDPRETVAFIGVLQAYIAGIILT